MKRIFIWGAGGVGKSHVAIRQSCQHSDSLLVTLDPSRRVFDLLGVPPGEIEKKVSLDGHSITVKTLEASHLFEQLTQRIPANPKVRIFYNRMLKGLREFQEYLALIQLSDELKNSRFAYCVIDTPPFQEAVGLHRAIFKLKDFFSKSLVQFALKSTKNPLIHTTIKKVFESTRIFVGKSAADQVFEFIEWLTQHMNRFQTAAEYLEELLFSADTEHIFILTPETRVSSLESTRDFFKNAEHMRFLINRSMSGLALPENISDDLFLKEMHALANKEKILLAQIQKKFPQVPVSTLPLMFMGEDTEEELMRFVKANG